MSLATPAVLPSSRADFDSSLSRILASTQVSRVQIDLVDGILARPASWPYAAPGTFPQGFVLPRAGEIEYEMDLMVLDAIPAAGPWLAAGATRLIFHIESVVRDPDFFDAFHRRYGESAHGALGLAVNTTTTLSLVEKYAPHISFVQCMGIARIGRQGEAFDTRALDQVKELRRRFPHLPVQVDGGVTLENARTILGAGASTLVVGSAILHAKDPVAAITSFETLQTPYGV